GQAGPRGFPPASENAAAPGQSDTTARLFRAFVDRETRQATPPCCPTNAEAKNGNAATKPEARWARREKVRSSAADFLAWGRAATTNSAAAARRWCRSSAGS